VRVGLGIALGYYAVRILPGQLGLPAEMGAVSITLTTGLTAWVEMTLLRRALGQRIGALPSVTRQVAIVTACAAVAAAAALALKVGRARCGGVDAAANEDWSSGFGLLRSAGPPGFLAPSHALPLR